MVDLACVADLLGNSVTLSGKPAENRLLLLDGLCDLVGAGAWAKVVYEEPLKTAAEPRIVCQEVTCSYKLIEMGAVRNGTRGRLSDLALKTGKRRVAKPICARRRLPDGRSIAIVFFKDPSAPSFSERDRRLAGIVLEEVEWLYETMDSKVPEVGVFPEMAPQLRETFHLLRLGCDRKVIAGRLGISPGTVAGYVKTVYRKTGVSSQLELMRKFQNAN